MIITNDTTIVLCAGVPFDNTYQHVRLFDNMADRLNYFNSLAVTNITGATYQRQNKYISFPVDYDSISSCDYLYFKNASDGKYYFAFITAIEYQNANLSRVYFEIDQFQSWFDPTKVKECFVLREHTNDDTFGKNLVPENLETGEYIYNTGLTETNDLTLVTLTPCIVMGVSERLGYSEPISHMLDKSYTALAYYYADTVFNELITSKVEEYAQNGKADAIVCLFMYPKELLSISEHVSGSGWLNDANTTVVTGYSLTNPFAPLDGYTPKNNKMYTYPYRYLEIVAPGSTAKAYYYEYFGKYTDMFTVFSTLGGAAPIIAVPNSYKRVDIATDEPTTMSPYPTCSWTNDNYKNWFAQNIASITYDTTASVLNSAVTGGAQIATGDIAGGASSLLSGFDTIGRALVTQYQHSIIPDSARGNVASANSFYANNQCVFYAIPRCIRYEFAKRIDDYFTFYGYATNAFKQPNLTGRKSWNFVKLAEANLNLVAPIEATAKIKQALESGVTFWHTNDIKNYTLDNSII